MRKKGRIYQLAIAPVSYTHLDVYKRQTGSDQCSLCLPQQRECLVEDNLHVHPTHITLSLIHISDELTQLQKEWKTIGPVAKKYSDAVWKRFISACDYFFEQKNKATSSQRSVEQENLEKKKNIIEKLNAIDDQMDTEGATQLVRDLMKEWNGVGHVPFKEKDRIYKQYHSQIDKLFERFNISASNKKLSNFKSTISSIQEGSPQALYREREKLVRAFDNMKNELQTYENNLGFLTTSSKKGNSLLTEINRKVEKLKADIELVKEKIKVVDENIKNQG